MNEEMKMILELTKENTRLKAVMDLIKANYDSKKKNGYNTEDEEIYLRIAGMEEKEIVGITFDNCGDVAL